MSYAQRMKSNYLTSVSFSDFALSPDLDSALNKAGFSYCTEIQQLSLPLMLEGKDIAAQSQTGTGKTAAFLLGMYPVSAGQSQRGRTGNPEDYRVESNYPCTNP